MDSYGEKLLAEGRRLEREEILLMIDTWHTDNRDDRAIADVIEEVRSRGEESGKIERLNTATYGESLFGEIAKKVNELIDKVNEMRGK